MLLQVLGTPCLPSASRVVIRATSKDILLTFNDCSLHRPDGTQCNILLRAFVFELFEKELCQNQEHSLKQD